MLKVLLIIATLCLGGCVTVPKIEDPKLSLSPLQEKFDNIKSLDGPKITIAVYEFTDKTGQRKPSQKFSQLSSAVTQGAEVWVIEALQKIGNGTWFQVVERIGLDNLIKERQLIRSTREQYEEEKSKQLKPLKFAGIIVEGGVVGYDSNIATGGAGARYLGIGVQQQYRVDILSVSYGSSVFKFLDLGTRAIETESGITENEPVNYAVRAAIEQAVVEIILQGQQKGLWKFKEEKKVNVK